MYVNNAMYVSQNRIDISLIRFGNSQVAKNREIVKVLMDIILYLSKYDSAFHGHNEQLFTNDSFNSEKFLGLSTLLSKFHPVFAHLASIENSNKSKKLTFMSKDS